jgi:Cobalt transport protein
MSWIATLMLTTPFPRLLDVLRFYRLPPVLIGAIGMSYRYALLLADECYRMIAASRVRGGLNIFYGKIESTAMILAQVIIRAYDRAARLQQAMVTRGADFSDVPAPIEAIASVDNQDRRSLNLLRGSPLRLPDAINKSRIGARLGMPRSSGD